MVPGACSGMRAGMPVTIVSAGRRPKGGRLGSRPFRKKVRKTQGAGMAVDLAEHKQRFLQYADGFKDVPDAAPLRLKREHTFRVLEHACLIVDHLSHEPSVPLGILQDAETARASVLAALYHDCGRFPQFRQYRTFLDARSVNHAELSFKVMRDEGFLQEETCRVRGLAQCAVLLHNRHRLSPLLEEHARFVTDVVRDADKLDIFRIMVSYLTQALPEKDAVLLHVKDDPSRWSRQVEEDVLQGRVARYEDLRFVNDFRLLLGSWMNELRFDATRRALAESGLMETVLEPLSRLSGLKPAVDCLYRRLEACRLLKGSD